MKIDLSEDSDLKSIAKLLAACCTGSDITDVLHEQNIPDELGSGQTKWKRLHRAFTSSQAKYQCSSHTFAVIKDILKPSMFVDRRDEFEENLRKLNAMLAFSGFEYGADGKFRNCVAAQTLSDAQRYNTIQTKLQGRNIHPQVLAYCKSEILQDNYFHAVFEATKGLADHIRTKSGSTKDGATLVDEVFAANAPILAFNDLKTETEKSEHKGFAALLKGCFAAIRNPHAHTPKIHWEGDDNAADYLTLISLLHRKIDDCHKVVPH